MAIINNEIGFLLIFPMHACSTFAYTLRRVTLSNKTESVIEYGIYWILLLIVIDSKTKQRNTNDM